MKRLGVGLFNTYAGRRIVFGMLALVFVMPYYGYAEDQAAPASPAETTAQPAAAGQPAETAQPAEAAKDAKPAESAPAAGTEAKSSGSHWIRGSVNAQYDGAWAKHASDTDFSQTLDLKVDPPGYDRLHLRGLFWMNEDLGSNKSKNSGLRDVNDASSSDVRARLMYLYADVDDLVGNSTLRIGRQRITEGAAFNRIDGVYYKQRYAKWDWYVFGGVRATIYGDSHENLTAGGGVSYRPFDTTRLALDYYYGQDKRDSGEKVERGFWPSLLRYEAPRKVNTSISDSLLALSLWQDITPEIALFSRLKLNENGFDGGTVSLNGVVPKWGDLGYEVTYQGRMDTVRDRVSDLTGYYRIMGSNTQYNNLRLALNKPITKIWTVSFESEFQQSNHDNTYNRDFVRLAAIVSADSLWKGIGGNVACERWYVNSGEGVWSVSGELVKKWKTARLALGSDFQRYEDRVVLYHGSYLPLAQAFKTLLPGTYNGGIYYPIVALFDEGQVETHQNVRSVYLKGKWTLCDSHDLNFCVRYEHDDGPRSPYWRVQTGYTYRF